MPRSRAKRRKQYYSLTVSSDTETTVEYRIDLDQLDLALLPIDRLLEKIRNNADSAVLWHPPSDLDTGDSAVSDIDGTEYRPFELHAQTNTVSASEEEVASSASQPNRSADPDSNFAQTQCHICSVAVFTDYLREHDRSETHLALLRLANAALRRLNLYTEQLIDKMALGLEEPNRTEDLNHKKDIYYCVLCNVTVDKDSREAHNTETRHKYLTKRSNTLTELSRIYTGEVIDDFANEKTCVDPIDYLAIGNEIKNVTTVEKKHTSPIDGSVTVNTINFGDFDVAAVVAPNFKTFRDVVQEDSRKALKTSEDRENEKDNQKCLSKNDLTIRTEKRIVMTEPKDISSIIKFNNESLATTDAFTKITQNDDVKMKIENGGHITDVAPGKTENVDNFRTVGNENGERNSIAVKGDNKICTRKSAEGKIAIENNLPAESKMINTKTDVKSKNNKLETAKLFEKTVDNSVSDLKLCDKLNVETGTIVENRDSANANQSLKGIKTIDKSTMYYCTDCQMSFIYHENTIFLHNNTKKHKMRVERNKAKSNSHEAKSAAQQIKESKSASTLSSIYYCKVCQKYLPNTVDNINDHNNGKKHKMQEERTKVALAASVSNETKNPESKNVKQQDVDTNVLPPTSADKTLNVSLPKTCAKAKVACETSLPNCLDGNPEPSARNAELIKTKLRPNLSHSTHTHATVPSKVPNANTHVLVKNPCTSKDIKVLSRIDLCMRCELNTEMSVEHLASYEHKSAVKRKFGFDYNIQLDRNQKAPERCVLKVIEIFPNKLLQFMELKKFLANMFVLLTLREGFTLPIPLSNWQGLVADDINKDYQCIVCNEALSESGAVGNLHPEGMRHHLKVVQPTQDGIRQVHTDQFHCVICNIICDNRKTHINQATHLGSLQQLNRTAISGKTIIVHQERERRLSMGVPEPIDSPLGVVETSGNEKVSQSASETAGNNDCTIL